MSFINCSTVKTNTFVEAAPFVITAPYYNSWIAGIEGGGLRDQCVFAGFRHSKYSGRQHAL
ncbi:hypothetical protein N9186_00390 [Flavobacteriaceae bacterium]|nr:hypothetical protein [Flavobacteriaceae bacterium]